MLLCCLIFLNCHFVFADEREKVQKKTFTKWINSHLQRVGARVNDLYHDLKEGKKLILLLEILSGEKLVRLHRGNKVIACQLTQSRFSESENG